MTVPTMAPSSAPANSAAPAPVPNSQKLRLRLRNSSGCQDLDFGELCQQLPASAVDIRAGRNMYQQIGDHVRWSSDIGLRLVERGEDIGRCGERPDAVGNRRHPHRLIANFGAVADAGDPEPPEICLVDRDGMGGRESLEIAFDHIPGMQSRGARHSNRE